METVTIQIRTKELDWEQTPKVEHTFNNWKEVSTFAYRLARQVDKEIRVEKNGNGHYYAVSNASNFLNSAENK